MRNTYVHKRKHRGVVTKSCAGARADDLRLTSLGKRPRTSTLESLGSCSYLDVLDHNHPYRTAAMLSPRGGRCLRQLTTQPSPVGCLPAFLLPAFSSTPTVRPFSTSIPCASRVGGATLSLPPEVNMTILAPPTPKNKNRISRVEPVATVEVEGPLGRDQCTGSAVESNGLRRQDVDAAATLHGHRAQRCSQEGIVEGPGP